MKKFILFFSFLIIFTISSFSENYYFLIQQSETNRYVQVLNNPFSCTNTYIVRLSQFNAAIQNETTASVIPKPEWVLVAQNVYTNGLTALGFSGAWSNMNYTFELIGASLIQNITQNLVAGNLDEANSLSTWKGLLKDTYESLLTYSKNYGITDMRLYPYDSDYIYSNTVIKTYIEYNGNKYYFP